MMDPATEASTMEESLRAEMPMEDTLKEETPLEEQVLAGPGDWGVANFRIPALAKAPNGDLLVAFDKRPEFGDAPAPNSIWQRRSADGGRTWGEPEVVRAGVESSEPGRRIGFSDPSYVVDEEAGLVLCFHVLSKDAGVWDSAHGNDDEDRRVLSAEVSVSRDSGITWEHRSITEVAKPEGCRAAFASSGAGIQLRCGAHRGRLVQQFAGFFRIDDGCSDGSRDVSPSSSDDGSEVVSAYSVYSDDHGETWTMGARIGTDMDENKVAELSDGTLLLNSREHAPTGRRWVARSRDGGETWEDLHRDPSIVDPGNNAHLVRAFPDAPCGSAKARILLLSHADHEPDARVNGTIEVSADDGATWARKRVFQPGACQYSVIIPIGGDELLLAYEGADETIRVARLDMDRLLPR